jgi:hypothetical protein
LSLSDDGLSFVSMVFILFIFFQAPGMPAANVSGEFQIAGGFLAALRDDVKRHLLAFIQAAHSGRFDGGDIDEYVIAALIRLYQTKPGSKPFNSTLSQIGLLGKSHSHPCAGRNDCTGVGAVNAGKCRNFAAPGIFQQNL